MYESLHIPDDTLIRLFRGTQGIIEATEKDVEIILGQSPNHLPLTVETQERIKSLVATCLLVDRLIQYTSYPQMIESEAGLKSWFRSESDFADGKIPFEVLKEDPKIWIPRLRDALIYFFGDNTLDEMTRKNNVSLSDTS